VLVVDDDEIARRVAAQILRQAGASVEAVGSGAEAVQRFAGGAPLDALLVDLMMPAMDGFQTALAVRATRPGAAVPILALTAEAPDGERPKCLRARINQCLQKPLEPDKLVEAVARWLPERGEPAGLDAGAAARRLGGKTALLAELLEVFRRDFADAAWKIRSSLAAGDGGQAARVAHSLQGAAGNLSADRLHAAAARVRDSMSAGRSPDEAALDALDRALFAALAAAERVKL
jgi:CheY-like chemotaxis protein/HPt (histidine-containing phosphotransfer) domain-containing protein